MLYKVSRMGVLFYHLSCLYHHIWTFFSAIQMWDHRTGSAAAIVVPAELEHIISEMARNGQINYDWKLLRKLIQLHLCKVR